MGLYLIIYDGRTSEQAYAPLKVFEPYISFRDVQETPFRLLPKHCLRAVAKALKLGWLDFSNWNSAEYEHFEQPENGDINIIVPDKFVAFAGPHGKGAAYEGHRRKPLTPQFYIPLMKLYSVSSIIRLNDKQYEREEFVEAGFEHHDLCHEDGSTPSEDIKNKFIQICEDTPGIIAVHCRGGIGRTGTCMALYIMSVFGEQACIRDASKPDTV